MQNPSEKDLYVKRLAHENQCSKCPWKVSTNPHEIPNGYSAKQHAALKATIAVEGAWELKSEIRVMACHEHDNAYCLGWLMNQLREGNNIPLRIKMLGYDLSGVKLFGAQHTKFEDTIRD